MLKPSFCSQCPINHVTGTQYVPLKVGSTPIGGTLVVGEWSDDGDAKRGEALSGGTGAWLNNMLAQAGQSRDTVSIINTLGCALPGNIYPTDVKWHATSRADGYAAVEHCCRHHLWSAIDSTQPHKIIALGDQAVAALTPRRGVMVWRGSPLPLKGDMSRCRVMPVLHPSYIIKDSKYVSTTISDLRKRLTPPPEDYLLFANADDLATFTDRAFAFDFEWDRFQNITLCGLASKFYQAVVGGWYNGNVEAFKRIFLEATDLIGHNIIGADTTYFKKLGWVIKAKLHDTMLKQHLVQPDMRHGLGFVGSVFTNKPFWKGTGEEEEDDNGNVISTKVQWKTWNTSEAIPRELGGYGGCNSDDEAYRLYNARDTDASFQINHQLDILLKRYGLESTYWNISVPIAHIVQDIADHGIKIDPSKVKVIRRELQDEIAKLEGTLPEGLRPYEIACTKSIPAPPNTYKQKILKCKGTKKAKTAHELLVWAVDKPGPSSCSICAKPFNANPAVVKKIKVPSSKRIVPWNSSSQVMAYARSLKLKVPFNRKRGTEAADVNARKGWGRTHSEFRIIDKLKDNGTELNTFAKAELEHIDRLFFQLLVHGTNEGRLACRGLRKGIDPNIQNQPKSIRKIYIPEAGNSFIELDYASGENMLTAHIAKDWPRLERLRQPGYSEHLELAKLIFNLPSSITKKEATNYSGKDLYDIGKHINHGSNYGMTYVKLKEYCDGEGYFFSEKDCKEFLAIGKRLNPRTAQWQLETIELAKRDGYLRNPFGRIRWFSSRSVSTQCLAFLPASTLADIILRAMIAHYPQRFSAEISNLGLQRTSPIYPGWSMSAQIHDSLIMQGPAEHRLVQAARTKAVMTQPFAELDGFHLDVEIKSGEANISWGELKVVNV